MARPDSVTILFVGSISTTQDVTKIKQNKHEKQYIWMCKGRGKYANAGR